MKFRAAKARRQALRAKRAAKRAGAANKAKLALAAHVARVKAQELLDQAARKKAEAAEALAK